MKKSILTLMVFSLACAMESFGDETAMIIKVNGSYGIINKGVNQGIKEGQTLYVKRESANELLDITKVKVFRTTANRAAVQQIKNTSTPLLHVGDKLYGNSQMGSNLLKNEFNLSTPRVTSAKKPPIKQTASIEPITEPRKNKNKITVPKPNSNYTRSYNLKYPWVSLNLGVIFPRGELANAYAPSIKFGASYMVSTGNHINIGIEVNKTFFSGSSLDNDILLGSNSIAAASILEAFVVFQKYFGNYFFIETGGGIYRPKIRTVSFDNFESTYSSSNFGVFGGTGFFVPTSKYAGFTLKGRMHNYFNQTTKQYFGLIGGFRFNMQ